MFAKAHSEPSSCDETKEEEIPFLVNSEEGKKDKWGTLDLNIAIFLLLIEVIDVNYIFNYGVMQSTVKEGRWLYQILC